MKCTVLVDNISSENISGEWGLCIHIEYNGKKYLLDTGSSNLFIENAQKMNIDLEDVDLGILSHAHYDHGNGIEAFFNSNTKAKFIISQNCKCNCYEDKKFFLFKKYIGIPKNLFNLYEDRFVRVANVTQIDDGVFCVAHNTPNLENIGKREKMYQKHGIKYVFDDFSHEQSLVFQLEDGIVIFNSCSHGGIENIIREVHEAFEDQPILGYIGGLHLFSKSPSFVCNVAQKIRENGVKKVITGHCTGDNSYSILQTELPNIVEQLHVGKVFEF